MKRFPFYLLPFGLSIGSFLMFSLANSYVDTEGILHEPFYLILLGFAFLLIGLVLLVLNIIRRP